MKAEKRTAEKSEKKRFKVTSPGFKTIITNESEEVAKALEKFKSDKAKSIDVSDENDKSTTHYTRGTFERNYHAHVIFRN
jgi:hypothetical protein